MASELDSLLTFDSEPNAKPHDSNPTAEADVQPAGAPGRRRFWLAVAAAVVVAAVVATGLVASSSLSATLGLSWLRWLPGGAAGPRPATLTVTTRPDGAQVLIDGASRGVTPLTLSVEPGPHTLIVRAGGHERVIAVTAGAGADILRDIEMTAVVPAPATGVVSVVTDPPGAQVTIDGRPSGTSPVTAEALAAGEHTIAVAGATGSATRTVTVAAGQTASVVFSLPRTSGPVGGWLSVSVPFDVQIVERDEVIGTSGAARIMLAAGRHDIVLVNRVLGYQEARRIEVVPGQTTVVRIDPPKVSININARPWADVTIDGRELGQTPISNAVITVGTHEVVFRHPQLGERRQTVVVTGTGPQRVAVDLTK